MVTSCSVPGCKFNYKYRMRSPNTVNVSLHRIPTNQRLQKLWLEAIGRNTWIPTSKSCICSQHFKPEDMDYTGQTRRLREGAVPSIFPWTTKNKINEPANLVINQSAINKPTNLVINQSAINKPTNLVINQSVVNKPADLVINQFANVTYIPVLIMPGTSAVTAGSNFILSNPICTENVVSRPVYTENHINEPINNRNVTEINQPKDTEIVQIQPLSCVNTDDAIYIYSDLEIAAEPSKSVSLSKKTLPYSKIMKEKIQRSSYRLQRLKKKQKTLESVCVKLTNEGKNDKKIMDYFEGNPKVLNIVHILNMLKIKLPPGVSSLVKRTVLVENCENNCDIDIRLQNFAAKLYSFSEKAYEFVRSSFNNALPSLQVIKDIPVSEQLNVENDIVDLTTDSNCLLNTVNGPDGQVSSPSLDEVFSIGNRFLNIDTLPVVNNACSVNDTDVIIEECDDDKGDSEHTPFPRRLSDLNSEQRSVKKSIRTLQQKIRRLEKSLTSNKQFMRSLVAAGPVLKDISDILEKTLPHDICSLVKRAIGVENNEDAEFEPDLISFALTLHHLSPEAYIFMRHNFNNALPCLNTIQNWYNESESCKNPV